MLQKCIVVGTDFSEASLEATWVAAAWAERLALPLTLVHAYGPAPVGPDGLTPSVKWAGIPNSSRVLAERAEEKLAELEESTLAGVTHDAVVLEHVSAAAAICEEACKRSADLVVVGTHGKKGFDRIVLGSVAEQVVRHAPCSVLVARGSVGDYGIPRRVLLCTDLSLLAEPAIAAAADLAGAFDAEVTLMHVSPRREALPKVPAARFVRPPTVHVAIRANVPAAIVEHAAAAGTDLIVVGTHGRTGVPRLLLGSVAERVARRAGCAVLVARARRAAQRPAVA